MSIYLCSHHFESKRSTINPGSKEPNSVVALNDSESSGSSGSDTEPDICEWSKTRTYRSLLILDNCDFVLHESRRQEFIDFINSQLDRCHYGKLSLVITSQEQLNFLDNCFQNFPIAELDPTDSVNLLRHHIPNLNDEMAQQFSSLVGHCPLALKVIGRLLAARGIENMETLLNSLKEKAVSTISNRITDNKERFRTIMDVAYSNLDIENQECSLIVSFFQSSFDSEIGTTILSGIVNPDCVQNIVQKSFLEEYFVASKTRYTMHKLVRSYFQEVHINDSFYVQNRKLFIQNFIANYSDYLISIMKDRYKFKNITDEESHRFFYLEHKNIKYFSQELVISAIKKIKLNDNHLIALAMLIIENISNGWFEKEVAFKYYFTDHNLYWKLCHFSSVDICSQFMWKLLVYKGIPHCTRYFENDLSPVLYFRILNFFLDEKPDCEIFACKNLTFLTHRGTLSLIAEQVEKSGNGEEKHLLSILETVLLCCTNLWVRNSIQVIKYAYSLILSALPMFMSSCVIFLTMWWFKAVTCSSFKESVTFLKNHFMLCCFLNWLEHTCVPNQINFCVLDIFIILLLLLLIVIIVMVKNLRPKCIHHRNVYTKCLTNVLVTIDVLVIGAYARILYFFYCHLLFSMLVHCFVIFVSKKKRVKYTKDSDKHSEQLLDDSDLLDYDFLGFVVVLTIVIALLIAFVLPYYAINAIFYSISWLSNPTTVSDIGVLN